MATLALGLAGTAIGAGIGGGVTILGATLTSAAIGGAIGSTVGGYIDSLIVSSLTPAVRNEGPRLQEVSVMQSSEGTAKGRLYGIMRVNGNLIWSTRFKETKNTETETVGGKGGGGGQEVETTSYTYSVSIAVAFGEGNSRTHLGRIWMDGKEVDLSTINSTFYPGTETQAPDSLIQSIEGPSNTPAFRGTCYVVFEDLQLAKYGNRIPQITAEIISPLETNDPDDISNIARSFCLIPGSGEFAYGTDVYTLQNASDSVLDEFYPSGSFTNRAGNTISLPPRSDDSIPAQFMNMHNQRGTSDAVLSLDMLKTFQPNMNAIVLVVGWFGNDLRIGECELRPYVEFTDRDGVVVPREWNVAGLNRAHADVRQVARDSNGNPVYGGTPSDDTVIELIQHIKSLGWRVIFYPFIFMHIEPGNTLPDPYSDNAAGVGQPIYPWRGRITCSPAAGFAGSVDKTATAATQVNTFFTRTWGFNNMIEHYAQLCEDAGGVDAFIIGTEMVGMTRIRSSASNYPAVSNLQTLAASVKAIMTTGSPKISYAADWSEYHSHRPSDGTNDVYFNLDPLWADPNIDFVSIDNYLPLSDWRDGTSHLDYDADAGIVTPHNISYLKSNVEGGEYYDWFYASQADRDSQTRTPIIDGAHGKPWVFRQKDIRNWWNNTHINRPGGTESGPATAWTAGMKPIWFTEFGAPAVDKATNQPNVFYDPKSSESFFPYYSSGLQDEYISRAYAEAMLQYWRDNSPAGMIDIENMFIWTWDTRPYPDFPARLDVWSDGDLWELGHWMTGRIAYPSLARFVESLCEKVGVTDHDTSLLEGAKTLIRGYHVQDIVAIRDIIGALQTAFQFDSFESEGKLKFALKEATQLVALQTDQFVSTDSDMTGFSITRAQDTELPKRVTVDYIDAFNDYEVASLDAKRHQTDNEDVAQVQLPISLSPNYVRSLADSILHQAWLARERGVVNLPPSLFKLDPGDGITFPLGNRTGQGRIQSIDTGEFREVQFQSFDLSAYQLPIYPDRKKAPLITSVPGFPSLMPLDIPLFSGGEPSHWSPRAAVYANPWPGSVNVYKDADADLSTDDWTFIRELGFGNIIGELESSVGIDRVHVWLRNSTITVNLLGGTLPSASSDIKVLNGANVCAMRNNNGFWEVFQYKTATLNGSGRYVLSDLIRGQLGTDWVMGNATFDAGNPFVLLENQFSINPATAPYLPLTPDEQDTTVQLRFGNASKALTDSTAYLGLSYYHTAQAKKPYPPVQLKATWALGTNNDIALSWARRTRFNGDNWNSSTVPLNEDTEEYELEILNGSTVVREVTGLTSPVYTYTEAQQIADFGSFQTALVTFRVYQISSEIGRGNAAEETIVR